MPVKSFISPALAFLYIPLGSLFSQVSRDAFANISRNLPSPANSLQKSLSFAYGEINAVMAIMPASAKRFATSDILRIFSFLASGEKPSSSFFKKIFD